MVGLVLVQRLDIGLTQLDRAPESPHTKRTRPFLTCGATKLDHVYPDPILWSHSV